MREAGLVWLRGEGEGEMDVWDGREIFRCGCSGSFFGGVERGGERGGERGWRRRRESLFRGQSGWGKKFLVSEV